MPNKQAAKKDLRQNQRRRLLHRTQRASLRTVLKKFREAVDTADSAIIEPAFRLAVKRLDQAAAKNLIHANKAARMKSRMCKLMPRRNAAAPVEAPAVAETAPVEDASSES
ncbi:MAG: 30S ribosomal protein S20 [Planctomycetota bacterium]|nr:30S ribosomal protein S20 [Planctomycetota bacterium]